MQKKYSMIYLILPPKAEEGWIKPDQCQVNSTLLELTYYTETLHEPTTWQFENNGRSKLIEVKNQL